MESVSTHNSQPTTITEPVTKQSSFLVTLLSVLLLISSLIAGFFAWKTQRLVSDLRVVSSGLKPTPTATSTPDPTADWKTYTIDDWTASFKSPYQPNLNQGLLAGRKMYYENAKNNPCPNVISETKDLCIIPGKNWSQTNDIQKTNLTGKLAISFFVFDPKENSVLHVVQTSESPIGEISAAVDGMMGEQTFQQILSTFKFEESVSSGSPVACTMEARICPDGSAVGRSGPKCEFANCPN